MLKNEWFRVALGMFVVAFGANLFAPMVLTYQLYSGLSASQTTFLFGIYALGLVVALFIGGPLSDTLGRRTIIRPAFISTLTGSAILLLGSSGSFPALLLGRLVIGVAVGLTMAAGAAWMKELSSSVSSGAQRSSLALTLGFAIAPLISGLLAQFFPHPTVTPYLAHLVLVAVIVPIAWCAPSLPPQGGTRAWFPRNIFQKEFVPVILFAPWVFGAASTAFAFLPTLLRQHSDHAIALAGFIALLTMGTGAFSQRLAPRLSATAGMAAATVGMVVGLAIVLLREHSWTLWLLPVSAVIMGFSYGLNMVNGLAQTHKLAPPAELGAATGLFYTLTYLGFFAPFVLTIVGPAWGYGTVFGLGIVEAAITMLLCAYFHRAKTVQQKPLKQYT